MPNLPKFDDKVTYVVTGKLLNQLIAAIKSAQILSAQGFEIERTPEGVRLKPTQQP